LAKKAAIVAFFLSEHIGFAVFFRS
ncbi:MAG: hypothetical protein Q609_ECAC01714G0006, partial [Escherichia coli DORA_A_5_14_21]